MNDRTDPSHPNWKWFSHFVLPSKLEVGFPLNFPIEIGSAGFLVFVVLGQSSNFSSKNVSELMIFSFFDCLGPFYFSFRLLLLRLWNNRCCEAPAVKQSFSTESPVLRLMRLNNNINNNNFSSNENDDFNNMIRSNNIPRPWDNFHRLDCHTPTWLF